VNQERLSLALAEQEEHLSEGVTERLESQVLPHISGSDHLRLVSYYSVLQKICDVALFHSLTPSQHVKLIRKVKATCSDIDYKVLTSEPDAVLGMLANILTQDNIMMVAKLLKTLPGSLQCTIQPSQLYRAWMQKLFFQVCLDPLLVCKNLFIFCVHQVSKNSTEEQWIGKFNICSEHFAKLSAAEFEDLASELAFSVDAYNCISRECRLQFLSEMLKFSRGRQQM
jgi:hypothetical protein